jgi:hypothetical protein
MAGHFRVHTSATKAIHQGVNTLSKNTPQGCLFAILRLFGVGEDSGKPIAPQLPYRRKEFLLSKAEGSFYGVLVHVVDGQYLIFAKVRLGDLLYIPSGTQGRQGAFNRIQSKHVDFVLCHRNGVRPCLAIELNDSSHDEERRKMRDEFVVQALEAAGLPLLQFPAAASYNSSEVKARVIAAIRPPE